LARKNGQNSLKIGVFDPKRADLERGPKTELKIGKSGNWEIGKPPQGRTVIRAHPRDPR
jgi:hypothetical protein